MRPLASSKIFEANRRSFDGRAHPKLPKRFWVPARNHELTKQFVQDQRPRTSSAEPCDEAPSSRTEVRVCITGLSLQRLAACACDGKNAQDADCLHFGRAEGMVVRTDTPQSAGRKAFWFLLQPFHSIARSAIGGSAIENGFPLRRPTQPFREKKLPPEEKWSGNCLLHAPRCIFVSAASVCDEGNGVKPSVSVCAAQQRIIPTPAITGMRDADGIRICPSARPTAIATKRVL